MRIQLEDTVVTQALRVKPIEAVGRLGSYHANNGQTITAAELRL